MSFGRAFVFAALVGAGLAVAVPAAAEGRAVPIQQRVKDAQESVVARVRAVKTAIERNQWGDELIVSYTTLDVEETLKGPAEPSCVLAVHGGSFGGYTLHVSGTPEMKPGMRGVFLMRRDGTTVRRPHLGGQGILILDTNNRVTGTDVTLDDVRAFARNAR
jgi:hypothetical protein